MVEHRGIIGGTLLASTAGAWIAAASVMGSNPKQHWSSPVVLALFIAGILCLVASVLVLTGTVPKTATTTGIELTGSQKMTALMRDQVHEGRKGALIARLKRPALTEDHRTEALSLIDEITEYRPRLSKSIRAAKRAGLPVVGTAMVNEGLALNDRVLDLADAVLSVEDATNVAAISRLSRNLSAFISGEEIRDVLDSNVAWLERVTK